MAHPLRFHVLLLPNVEMRELIGRFKWLEELGIEVAATADHFTDWSKPGSDWFEPWTLLAAVAANTSQIRLATAVTQIPLRNPALLAHQVKTVDHVSGGRIELGIGTGILEDPSCEMMGLASWSAKERVDRFGDYVAVVDALLSNAVSSHEGPYYSTNGATMSPRPVQSPRPPLVVAAMGRRMIRHAAALSDIWNSLSFLADFDEQMAETAKRVDWFVESCAAIGRDPAEIRCSYTMFDAAARPKGGTIDYYASADLFEEMVERAIALGMSDIGLYYPLDPAQRDMFEQLATDVMPRLRQKHHEVSLAV